MTVRIYKWNDDSAPTLTGETFSVCQLLRACLVDGYNNSLNEFVEPAGWGEVYGSSPNLVLRNTSGKCVAVQQTGGVARFYGSDDASYATGAPVGNTYPASSTLGGGLYLHCSTTSNNTQRPWVLVADERAFYFWPGYNLTTAQGPSGSSTYQHCYFVGDIVSDIPGDDFGFVIMGATSTSATSSYSAQRSSSISGGNIAGHYLAGSGAQVGGAIACGKSSDAMYSGAIGALSTGVAYPDVHGGMSLVPVRVVENNVGYRGRMPGMFHPLHPLPGACGDTLSGVGPLAGKSFILLDLADGSTRGRMALQYNGDWRA